MNRLFIVIVALLTVLTVAGAVARNMMVRATVVAAILISGFVLSHVHNRAVLHRDFGQAGVSSGDVKCLDVWKSAQMIATERFHADELILLAANAAMAIIAVAPQRRKPSEPTPHRG